MNIILRNIVEDDLTVFFEFQKDPKAIYMAAFTMKVPSNWDKFSKHWHNILDNNSIIKQTITLENNVVGNILCFKQFGEREISYWIDRKYWSKGIATLALREFLIQVTERPLYARAVKDNIGSIKVLEKCGFKITGEGSGFANARGGNVEEFIFTLGG